VSQGIDRLIDTRCFNHVAVASKGIEQCSVRGCVSSKNEDFGSRALQAVSVYGGEPRAMDSTVSSNYRSTIKYTVLKLGG
jgi:hypothetical protein